MATKIQIRRDTAANWTSANPTLSSGELGYETNTGKWKIGDGTTAWNSLGYFNDLVAHLADTSDAHDASAISFSPTGTIAATDVQAALAEVASEAGGGTPGDDTVTSAKIVDATIQRRDLSAAARLRTGLGLPTGAKAQNYARPHTGTASATLTSGTLRMCGIVPLTAGEVYTSITMFSGATALSSGSNQWFALIRVSDLSVLRKTVDDTSTAWAANSAKTLNLSSTYTPSADEEAYLGVVVVATTPNSLLGVAGSGNIWGIAPVLNGNADTGLTNPASLGSTAAAPTASINMGYGYVS